MRSKLEERSRILTFTDVTPRVHSNPIKLSAIQFSDTNLPFIKLLPGVYICTAPVVDYNSAQVLELTQLSNLHFTVQRHRIWSPWRTFWNFLSAIISRCGTHFVYNQLHLVTITCINWFLLTASLYGNRFHKSMLQNTNHYNRASLWCSCKAKFNTVIPSSLRSSK
jgi:hypothetical protein